MVNPGYITRGKYQVEGQEANIRAAEIVYALTHSPESSEHFEAQVIGRGIIELGEDVPRISVRLENEIIDLNTSLRPLQQFP